ncbi:MAG: GHKL domain-containing protein [Nitrospirae bacterium]|nr:GHKL domain-containing protein [Nitrospirota bacterium]
MSLKKKIALSFAITSSIIAVLLVFEYLNFIEIKKEIRYLEITDTIRSKSLQLRRHEKNFFLYPLQAKEEADAVHRYIDELLRIVNEAELVSRTDNLENLINEYAVRFNKIEKLIEQITGELKKIAKPHSNFSRFLPLIKLTFIEQPLQTAVFLEDAVNLPSNHPIIDGLKHLDTEINILRKSGEDITVISKNLDKVARDNVEKTIYVSQVALLAVFPVFLVVGILTLFVISRSIVNRLRLLMDIVEKTGKGYFQQVTAYSGKWGHDEVGVLIKNFNSMEEQLVLRDSELDKKNKELLQSKKLAAIGTLAAGVAHELNNPLNNIYLSAQALKKEAGEKCTPFMAETLNDIVGQSIRVKKIVGDLLEYARGKEPHIREIYINDVIRNAYSLLTSASDMEHINFNLNTDRDKVIINADPEQMERVFINLFSNAVEAMNGKGDIIVTVSEEAGSVKIWVSDTGRGIKPGDMENIFEPFFTTKDKGTGLGLAIVYNIIARHKGRIMVESMEGQGATFFIALPKREHDNAI